VTEEHGGGGRRGPFARITNAAAGAVDVNGIVERIDVNELVDRIDIDGIVRRVDVEEVVDRIDPDRLLDRVDPNLLLDRVDPNRLLDRVDPNRLLDRVDPDRLLDRVDPNRLLDRVEPDRLLERVDPDRLLDRVDVDSLMDRVDIDRLMDRVDVKALVDKAGVADIVGDTTGQMAGSVLDAARRQIVAVDEIVGRIAYRIVRRDPAHVQEGPPRLLARAALDDRGRGVVQGHYAGPVSRLAAFLIDVFVAFGLYTLASAAIVFFLSTILRIEIPDFSFGPWIALATLAGWGLFYSLVSLVVAGKTVGKGIVGLLVVSQDGTPITGREATIRVITMPLSFIFFGIGLLGIAFGKHRRAWHDRFAGTAVVYDWGSRAAALPAPLTRWIEHRSDDLPEGRT
jgi:uncharacterized RDD family membrane protein YckC